MPICHDRPRNRILCALCKPALSSGQLTSSISGIAGLGLHRKSSLFHPGAKSRSFILYRLGFIYGLIFWLSDKFELSELVWEVVGFTSINFLTSQRVFQRDSGGLEISTDSKKNENLPERLVIYAVLWFFLFICLRLKMYIEVHRQKHIGFHFLCSGWCLWFSQRERNCMNRVWHYQACTVCQRMLGSGSLPLPESQGQPWPKLTDCPRDWEWSQAACRLGVQLRKLLELLLGTIFSHKLVLLAACSLSRVCNRAERSENI